MRENDKAWANYFQQTGLVLDGSSHTVKADDLKRVTQREPRLLTKFDTPEQLPALLHKHHYAVLPVRNGVYLIFQGEIFYSLPPLTQPQNFSPHLPFPLLTAGRGSGEMQYLDFAFNMGLLHHFIGSADTPLYLTIRGREFTGQFTFEASGQRITADSVQIEVDAGYEGEREIILCEAKIGRPSHLNIRQLYYPFRHFLGIAPQKHVRTLFFTYDLPSLTHTFYEFIFAERLRFDSLRLARYQTYAIDTPPPRTVDALLDARLETVNDIVPQADDFNKILEVMNTIEQGQNTARDVASRFGFTERQGYYYGEAAEFLGLVKREHGLLSLTDKGMAFLAASPSEQHEMIAKLVVNSWFFLELIHRARKQGYFDSDDISSLIASVQRGTQPRYSQSTIPRRRQTIEAWLRWLVDGIGCFSCADGKYFLK